VTDSYTFFDIRTKTVKVPRSRRLEALKDTITRLESEYSLLSKLLPAGDGTLLNFGGVIISLKNEYQRRYNV
jgi:hypothetical protein